MFSELLDIEDPDTEVKRIIQEIHRNGPVFPEDLEIIAYIKKFEPELIKEHEGLLMSVMGLFFKCSEPVNFLEEIYSIYSNSIKEQFQVEYTPLQASAYKNIINYKNFSFSAPTSSGKSYLLRNIIKEFEGDVLIIVPSRALISEYYIELEEVLDESTLLLQFVEDVNKKNVSKRVFLLTPERAVEAFKYSEIFNVELILMDEAQISEEDIRGLKFDAFVRRSSIAFPEAKQVFVHPFVENPSAQLSKHGYNEDSLATSYKQSVVGKIFISHHQGKYSYFSPYKSHGKKAKCDDIPRNVLIEGGTLLVYISKSKIYDGTFREKFGKYIDLCESIQDPEALKIIDSLREYIGASVDGASRHSTCIEMMEIGIAVHHGSMPLKARLLIEQFIRAGFASICFATSTLDQGINMPFDVVWIDNFTNMREIVLKNLIGRSGRITSEINKFDFGYTIINSRNVKTFTKRINIEPKISETSKLDDETLQENGDYSDIIEAVKEGTFNDDLHLPEIQVQRIAQSDILEYVDTILNNLIKEDSIITVDEYYKLKNSVRERIKFSLKSLYITHLPREKLTPAESSVISTAIPIMLWNIQGRAFSQIVSLRYSLLAKRDEWRALDRKLKANEITKDDYETRLEQLHVGYSQVPFTLPDQSKGRASLYRDTSVRNIDYDKIVYDTYDYLDKVISFSLVDPLCAAFEIAYKANQDLRARVMQNFIRYGTNDDTEIWLLKYGFDPEDILWLKQYISKIDENEILFHEDILNENDERLDIIERYF